MFIIGHRGARAEAPENTLEGFLYALKQGVSAFELDVRMAADGELVVFHDSSLERITHHTGMISDIPSQQLIKLDTRVGTKPWPIPAFIPTLETVLENTAEANFFQLEVKPENRAAIEKLGKNLVALIKRFDRVDSVVVTSLDTNVLRWFKENFPTIKRGYVAEWRMPNPLAIAQSLRCHSLIPNYKICSESLVDGAHRRGLQVSPWTVNNVEDMYHLAEIGVDSIITDLPTVAIKLFK